MSPSTTRIVAIVLAVVLVLGAAGVAIGYGLSARDSDDSADGPERAGPAPTSTPSADATEPPDPALAAYYGQSIDWAACEDDDDMECATLTVPVDYAEPDGETIDVRLLRDPADEPGQRVGSLVVNPGGPGSPGTSYAAAGTQAFRQPLLDAFDIVGFDPRGTGGSDPVDCLSDDELDAFLAADPDPDDAAEEQALVEDLDGFFAGCVERSDALVGHVTTVEAARDMDVLRAALGETTLTYLGASYGTKLGATYAELFPQRVGRLLLDGAVDVSLSTRESSLGQARGFETALRAYVEDCVSGDDCPLGGSVEEGLTTITDLLDDIDAQPLPTSDDRELTVGSAFYGVVTPLYVRDYWPLLTQGLEQALDGDGTTLMLLADAYASRDSFSGDYLNNSAEAIYAINCLDDPTALAPEDVPAQYADFEEASPTFGRVFAWGLVGCAGIEVEASEPAPQIDGAGAAPIVVVGTTRDPATPYEWAQALAEQLDSGVLVTRDGDGHTGYNSGNECVDTAVEDYLVEGTVPDDGLQC
ncbi:alpha/beta hydrolase [Nocardioides sp. P86]|uniref:alpha/beta hydrolase n=1 Tax=Nocardioides sp. P86 TaxID=2939569 RepID=UPI00203FD36D|nr:alpha/beta hydrolase [Nocardioides sp. P86]MCM3516861.1 alpha/beta hydrolase [Nocardioides sp. P86]